MATIFEKTTGDKCLILDSREALVYPFDLGNDWVKIRIGISLSLTSTSSDNGTATTESLVFNSPANGIYFGIKDSGNALPFQSASNFVGWATYTSTAAGVSSTITTSNSIQSDGWSISNSTAPGLLQTMVTNGTSINGFVGDVRGILATPFPANMTGATGYVKYNAVEIRNAFRGATGQIMGMKFCYPSVPMTDSGIVSLRTFIAALDTTAQTETTFFYTSGFVSNGGPLPIPNSFFFYVPFLSNRVRIHELVIEKY